ncbi:MAG TPA: hypothetical protein VEL07_18230 [Planctomycetota bacterium]|nr:hypothetical protein [Planctomycetota bacterium]
MPRAHRSGRPRRVVHVRRRDGFTLFETAISLAVIGTAVLSAMLMMPAGLRVHRLARFQLLAAAKAEELVELFLASANVRSNIESEATAPWEVPAAYGSQAMDLEARVASNKAGVIPLPGALSRRIDSDGDEIARILAEGGALHYFHPAAAGGFEEQVWLAAGGGAPTDAQKLVFAVRGAPQQNAIALFPWKAWPYYAGYPSPPTHVLRMHDADMAPGAKLLEWPHPSYAAFCFDGAGPASQPGVDADLAEVFACADAGGLAHGFEPYAYGSGPATPTVDGAIRYLQTALWYCARKGLGSDFHTPAATTPPRRDFLAQPRWQQVHAMRFLAHAGLCLTRWKTLAELGGQPSGAIGLAIPSVTIAGTASPAIELTHDLIRFWHDSALALARRYAAEDPYDWGAPRITQHALMTDHPLLQWDLFSPPLSGPISGAPGEYGAHWRPLSASPVTNIGVSMSYPAAPIPAGIWGHPEHFTLLDGFTLAERCRELVFWAVDWQAYEDCELCPSEAVDASRYNLAAPLPGVDFAGRMSFLKWSDPHLYAYRNPEKNQAFFAEVDDRATGAPIGDVLLGSYFAATTSNDQGASLAARQCFTGRWGADRDFDGVLDRGPVPPSVRLRAVTIGRFLFYDPRLPLVLR